MRTETSIKLKVTWGKPSKQNTQCLIKQQKNNNGVTEKFRKRLYHTERSGRPLFSSNGKKEKNLSQKPSRNGNFDEWEGSEEVKTGKTRGGV